jgi:hypothetical protein
LSPQKSPVLLKLIAVLSIVVGGYSAVHGAASSSALDVAVGAASGVSGAGLLLGKKWGWYLAVVVSAVSLVLSLGALAFLGALSQEFLAKMEGSFRLTFLALVLIPDIYNAFVVTYLLRRKTRTLFDISGPPK